MGFFELIILIFAIAVIGGIAQAFTVSGNRKEMDASLNSIEDFTATKKHMGSDGKTGLAVDEQRQKIVLVNRDGSGVSQRNITYRDILSSEVFVDGETITRTSRTSQVGGALLGGLMLGGVGALIGGLSGSKKSSEKINRIDLRITINDSNAPIHDINFLNVESKNDGWFYKNAMEEARYWHGLVAVLIKSADLADKEEARSASLASETSIKASIADELLKLNSLKEQGILSSEEFDQEKRKLLA